ncbi:Dimethylamine corrinoid protein 2 [Candidatus Desulfosporosinus infrequens]|uniref:Dimethylamine corrinoid protein 2 n=1 Tax=Candidatus Desulfosporosinus infrequens TaxID=2043169 RepID=A0A2U3K4C4_9FIRM|nr:Dimethylamine corrinoid protein 2 [Candidatus Desulfosporosinus infrequens]
MDKETLLREISHALVEFEVEKVAGLAEEALKQNISAYETITEGLVPGMKEVGRLYEEEEYFLPEVLMCSDAFNAGLDIVNPFLDKSSLDKPIKMVIGVIEGDTHDIGKNLVRILSGASGFEVYDLGRDVTLDRFIEKAEEVESDWIGMSTLMTTTMDGMKTVIDRLKDRNIRDKYKIIIGGGPISQTFCDKIGADLYANDASSAVRKVKELMGRA